MRRCAGEFMNDLKMRLIPGKKEKCQLLTCYNAPLLIGASGASGCENYPVAVAGQTDSPPHKMIGSEDGH